ncbi:MAG: chromosome segregation protein SMC [Acidobacteria bacterium]|nr:chromosome segregation protein SMC [Acidobacteriota bacterium]
MLKLRKVEILGFKSFSDKTHVTFSGTGVTGIVGPNGCGKSNIVDAISWVLGEQSHKSLRAERMSDCIFNGTAKRPPLGMAEVSLTLVDPELAEAAEKVMSASPEAVQENPELAAESAEVVEIPEETPAAEAQDANVIDIPGKKKRAHKPAPHFKPGEVVIGRRLYRSGQSEYLINGRVARLRDIQDIFMGTGLGPDSYAIIEQGRIGQILSSKPMDRRSIIEEAAGVTKYKTKRRLAEAKLESSKLNLSRVNDILVEVEKQLGSLKRQASKARRYAEIREQMRGLMRTVLASKAKELDAEAERIETTLRTISHAEQEQTQSLHSLETELAHLNARNYELETEIRQNQNLLGQTALELDRAENRLGFNRERSRELGTRSTQVATEIELLVAQAKQIEERVSSHQQSEVTIRDEHRRLEQTVAALAESSLRLTDEQAGVEGRIEELRATSSLLAEEITRLHGEQAQAESALAHHDEGRTKVEEFELKLRTESLQLEERAQVADAHWEAAAGEAVRLGTTLRDGQVRMEELRRQHKEKAAEHDRVREALATCRARRSTLEQILDDHSYTADSVRKLFAANGKGEKRGFRAVGVLADYAEVKEEHEHAVEQFLRDELEYVVVETFDHARAGIAMLREEVGGRATFFVDSIKKLNLPVGESPMPFHPEQGVVGRMDGLLEFRDPLGPAAKQFLPKLRSAFLVESPAVAEQLSRENLQYQFVTPDGSCYHGRLVSGGRPGEAGPLAMKRELRAIESDTLQQQRAEEELQAALAWLNDELTTQQSAHELGAAQQIEAEKNLVAATMHRDQARTEMARMQQQLTQATAEMSRLRTETGAASERATAARRLHDESVHARTAAESELVAFGERLTALRQELLTTQESLAAQRADLATLAERLASSETVAARLAQEETETRGRLSTLDAQRNSLAAEVSELSANQIETERQREALAQEKNRLEVRRTELDQEWEAARVRVVTVDDALRMSRQKVGDLREERATQEIGRAKNESERNHLRETCLAELNLQPEDLIAQEAALLTGEELAAADASYREMKSKIESMGPVNMMALEEYQECEQRFEFLTRESNDLVKSIEDTQQTIKELDEISRAKFEEAFRVINEHFAVAFRTLFGGGTGEMRLTEIDQSGDSGIDIVAQPPGKRLQNVLLLSGGEKALTALSLLIAVFRYQPSPFCILDEVDAPLDEANVGRFAKMIEDMSQNTQFIIVTHNRRTMEVAPVLYGVTMQDPGVSKLVSVRWEEREATPEQQSNAA